MTAIRTTAAILLTILLLALATIAQAGEFKVTRVLDGDTFIATGHDVEIVVRLMAIDAPELTKNKGEPGQPYSQAAKKLLTKLVYGKVVDMKGYGTDRYNWMLGAEILEKAMKADKKKGV